MPIQTLRKNGKIVGYRWGSSGKVFRSREKARRQGIAIILSKKRRGTVKRHIRKVNGRRVLVRTHKRKRRKNFGGVFFPELGTLKKDLKKLEKEDFQQADQIALIGQQSVDADPKKIEEIVKKIQKEHGNKSKT
tara:strand:+ start:199 stop:600 length:402 start_codon:yes stop_codon:yes gene_type:complete